MINDMYISSLCLAHLILVANASNVDSETEEALDVSMVMLTVVQPAQDLMTILLIYTLFLKFKLLLELTRTTNSIYFPDKH